MQVLFCGVFTCPPGRSLDARFSVVPQAFGPLVERVLTDYLPRIERGKGSARHIAEWPVVLAPLDAGADTAMARRLRASVYGPAGVEGLLVAPFVMGRHGFVGWLVVGAAEPSAVLLERHGAELAAVAAVAAQTLERAYALAAAVVVEGPSSALPGLERLSKREREVVRVITEGRTDAQAAAELGITEHTVGTHLKRIFEKLGVRSRMALVARVGRVR